MKMKYAFIIGSNAFIVAHGVICYADSKGSKEILRVKSIYHDNIPESIFSIDLDIEDNHGNPIRLNDNKIDQNSDFKVNTSRNSVDVLKADGSPVIHIHQMDDHTAMSLEHNITAELEISMPVAVIRIFGEFQTEGLHISAEGEKLFINKNGYATSALHGTGELEFTAEGVVL